VTVVELRRLSGRVSLLRAHVDLASAGERDALLRERLDLVSILLTDAERLVVDAAGQHLAQEERS
jgi:hypothetical protein